jgi:protein-S-isoprenylcysteine O-methyltransferase
MPRGFLLKMAWASTPKMQSPHVYFVCGSVFTLGAVYPSVLSVLPVISALSLLLFVYMDSKQRTGAVGITVIRGYDLRVLASLVAAEYLLVHVATGGLSLRLTKIVGAFGIASSVMLFCLTTRYLAACGGRGFTRDGPYRFVRHPMYLSLILFWCSACVYLLCFGALAVSLWFVKNRMRERVKIEEKAVAGTAVEYLEYKRNVYSGIPFYG